MVLGVRIEMRIEFTNHELLYVLNALKSKYVELKESFGDLAAAEGGIATPEEFRETFNNIIKQAHNKGELIYLDEIKNLK